MPGQPHERILRTLPVSGNNFPKNSLFFFKGPAQSRYTRSHCEYKCSTHTLLQGPAHGVHLGSQQSWRDLGGGSTHLGTPSTWASWEDSGILASGPLAGKAWPAQGGLWPPCQVPPVPAAGLASAPVSLFAQILSLIELIMEL